MKVFVDAASDASASSPKHWPSEECNLYNAEPRLDDTWIEYEAPGVNAAPMALASITHPSLGPALSWITPM